VSPRKVVRDANPRPDAGQVLVWLEERGTKKQIAELARYGIAATRPFGVSVGDLKRHAGKIGKDHDLALALWASGRYEARLLAAFVDEPERVTARQMDAWAAEFDNWAVVDTVCFHLFDRTRHAWTRVPRWARSKKEFTRRAAFALLWSLSVHDREAADLAFRDGLRLVEAAADDERPLVKKAVNMALRAVGKRNRALHTAAIRTAERLAARAEPGPRWIGGHALRELTSAAVRKRLA